MEEFEKALKEFCEWQGINKPGDIKSQVSTPSHIRPLA
jgi:hypothetical protein